MLIVTPESGQKTLFSELDEYGWDHTAHFSLVTRTDVPGSRKRAMALSATYLQMVFSPLKTVKSSSQVGKSKRACWQVPVCSGQMAGKGVFLSGNNGRVERRGIPRAVFVVEREACRRRAGP
jgi:hypothetical protein